MALYHSDTNRVAYTLQPHFEWGCKGDYLQTQKIIFYENNNKRPSADSRMWPVLRSMQEVPEWEMPRVQGQRESIMVQDTEMLHGERFSHMR